MSCFVWIGSLFRWSFQIGCTDRRSEYRRNCRQSNGICYRDLFLARHMIESLKRVRNTLFEKWQKRYTLFQKFQIKKSGALRLCFKYILEFLFSIFGDLSLSLRP